MNKMGFGFLRFGQDAEGNIDFDKINTLVDKYMELGGRYFDTAWTYLDGKSEEAISRCVAQRYPRSSFELCDKLPGYRIKNPSECRQYFTEQLKRCGVEYFDVYMLHWLNAKHYRIAEEQKEFDFLKEIKSKGLAKKIGFSFHDSPELLDAILTEHPETDVVLMQINYLDWDSAAVQSRKCYETAVRHGKEVMVMEPCKGGTLARLPENVEKLLKAANPYASPALWAMRFARSLPKVSRVLSGMSETAQIEENLQDTEPLNEQELSVLRNVAQMLSESKTIPCTGCRYCVSHCPMGIPIPDYFAVYNDLKRYPGDRWKMAHAYKELDKKVSLSECIACGSCMEHCPQHIQIPNELKRIAEENK